ncbi:MAG: non-homologous end-joining DNA ligase [Candidatus Methanoperedens sp.]|nr:non-homologous end-joining DNA ligase [Candidatus Methanoperedens sp.]MCZ7369809.1 non-homologous end-joining DNA ligase [Candidatus Methanoperedens sp.]
MDDLTKVSFTNLEKVLYPGLELKKSQVLEYYIRIAPRMLGFLKNRVIVMNRYPDGVDKDGFYEKDAPAGMPPWVKTFNIFSETAQREIDYVVCNDLDTLIWMANLAALEINITLSTIDNYDTPDLVFFDIDPEPPCSFDDVIDTAFLLKEKLDELSFRSFVKTSGKKGLHVVLPIIRNYNFKQTREFVHQIGKFLARESELVVSEFRNSRDPGTIFIDFMQNNHGKTMIAPYSLRAEAHAPVSTPLEWKELKKGLRPEEFNIFTVLKRKNDPWEGLLESKQSLEVE